MVRHFATIRYSPGIDLDAHRATLAEEGIVCEPVGVEDGASDLRHVPVLHLVASTWWRALDQERRALVNESMRRPSSATIVAGDPRDSVPDNLQDEALVA